MTFSPTAKNHVVPAQRPATIATAANTRTPRVTRERRGTRPRRGRGTGPARRSRTARACRSPRREPPAAPVPAARRSRTSAARARRRARRPGSGRGSTHRHPRLRSKRAPWRSRCRRGRRIRDRPPRMGPAYSPPAKYREPPRRGPLGGTSWEATMTCSRLPEVSKRAFPPIIRAMLLGGRDRRRRAVVGLIVLVALVDTALALAVLAPARTRTPPAAPSHPAAGLFQPDGTQVSQCADDACFRRAFGNVAFRDGPKAALDLIENVYGDGQVPRATPSCTRSGRRRSRGTRATWRARSPKARRSAGRATTTESSSELCWTRAARPHALSGQFLERSARRHSSG